MMKAIVKMSKCWIVGLLIGGAALMSARADTNTTYTVSFESYEVRGTTYSVPPITGIHTDDALPKLDSSTLQAWLLGWADAAGTKYYDEKGKSLLSFTGEADLALHALIDASYFVHQITFVDYVVGGVTNSVPPLTYREGDTMTNLVSGVAECVLGWYTSPNGNGTQYFGKDGKPIATTFTAQRDVTLYAKIDPQYLPLGVSVNGQELDAMTEAGRQGEGWSYDVGNRLVTLDASGEYVLSGSHTKSLVHFQVVTNATLVLSNLTLVASGGTRSSLIEVVPGVAADIRLAGENTLEAQVSNMAGIFCPTGAAVKIWSERTRDVSFANPTNMSYHGVLSEFEYDVKDLLVSGGMNAAAIGGRKATDGGLSGEITIQNCSVWARGGSNAYAVGAGNLELSAAGTNACGTIHFLGYPNVRDTRPISYQSSIPNVGPVLHGDWETPLFPREISSQREEGEQNKMYNVFWFPHGTTRVKTTEYSGGGPFATMTTNEVSYTIRHTKR